MMNVHHSSLISNDPATTVLKSVCRSCHGGCGALDNISVVIRLTLEQMVVPDTIRGRVSAVHFVFIGMSNDVKKSMGMSMPPMIKINFCTIQS